MEEAKKRFPCSVCETPFSTAAIARKCARAHEQALEKMNSYEFNFNPDLIEKKKEEICFLFSLTLKKEKKGNFTTLFPEDLFLFMFFHKNMKLNQDSYELALFGEEIKTYFDEKLGSCDLQWQTRTNIKNVRYSVATHEYQDGVLRNYQARISLKKKTINSNNANYSQYFLIVSFSIVSDQL